MGYKLHWYGEDPNTNPKAEPLHTTVTTQAQMFFADNLPSGIPSVYWLRVSTVYMAPKSTTIQIGLCVVGKGRLYIDGKEAIDIWTSHPKKTLQTPMFNQASMEATTELHTVAGTSYEISVLLQNGGATAGVGAQSAGGLRIGCCENTSPAVELAKAVKLARDVDIPIVIVGLNADYESEAVDRKDLKLPPGVDQLVEEVVKANPRAVS